MAAAQPRAHQPSCSPVPPSISATLTNYLHSSLQHFELQPVPSSKDSLWLLADSESIINPWYPPGCIHASWKARMVYGSCSEHQRPLLRAPGELARRRRQIQPHLTFKIS